MISLPEQRGNEWRVDLEGKAKINSTLWMHQLTKQNLKGTLFHNKQVAEIIGLLKENIRLF